ncbi:MAG: radical SAM protein [Bacteroidota bacterium]
MKVLLINPPSFNEIIGNNPSIIESERGHNPPLGLLLLAGYLLDHTIHKVDVLDSQVEELCYEALEERIKNIDFEVVGITTMTFTLIDVIKTVRLVKKINPESRVVLGGPHVNLFPEETIALDGVDFLVLGEGEIIFSQLLDNIYNYDELKKIKGLVFKDKNGEIAHTGIPDTVKDLDNLSFPARHLTPYKKYSSLLAKRTPITTMITSRGCPFKCSFCDRPHLGKKFRAMSAEKVVGEIEKSLKLGIHEFLIYDDTFTINKTRVKKICELIIEKKLDVGFDIRARVDTLNEELLLLLKKAGCRGIHYGVEAGTEKILKVLKKDITINKVKEIFNLTKKYKIPILAYFMIGCPDETRDDIYETFRVTKWLNPDFIHLTILTPFPGTPIYIDGLANGKIKKDYWLEFAKNPDSDFEPPFWDENFTKKELEELIIKGYKTFYLRPSYIFKRLFSIKSFGEFSRKAKAGLKVLFMKKIAK